MSVLVNESSVAKDWTWPIDGPEHKFIDRNKIYRNIEINDFLDGNSISTIVASKGMGKTLLMRVKHSLLMEHKEGAIVIPSVKNSGNKEYDEPKILSELTQTGFADIQLWKGLWSISIVLSILTHLNSSAHELTEVDFGKLENLIKEFDISSVIKDSIMESIRTASCRPPSYYLTKFLNRTSENELQRFIRSSNSIVEISTSYITSMVVVLIDGFDQTLMEIFPNNKEAWKDAQLGLVKASHTLFTTNHHIKVICTIRREAWSGFEDPDKQVIQAKSLLLDFSKNELEIMFLQALKLYEDKESILDLLGVDTIYNDCCGQSEKVFDYIYRHSSRSPRSIMQFGRLLVKKVMPELAGLNYQDRVSTIRKAVNAMAVVDIFEEYLVGQRSYFLKCLNEKDKLNDFLRYIPSNVLTSDSLKSIKEEFCKEFQIPEEVAHPFCELFNIGLLGEVRQNISLNGTYQYFRKPSDFDWKQQKILNSNTVYLVHPGLTSHIGELSRFKVNKFNVVGPDIKWASNTKAQGIPKVFISYASQDKKRVELIVKSFKQKLNLSFPSDIWFDLWKVLGGSYFQKEVEKGVDEADILVLFASNKSLKSGWVDWEWRKKYEEEIKSGKICVVVASLGNLDQKLPESLKGKQTLKMRYNNIEGSALALAQCVNVHLCVRFAEMP